MPAALVVLALLAPVVQGGAPATSPAPERLQLDAPLLFVKRHNYLGIHIYDTFYKWRPGGGIYIIENPSAPPPQQVVRPLIDGTTANTLGDGIYSEPELSWDAQRLLFCYKPTASGSTSIYEMGIDGTGLRCVSNPEPYCDTYHGSHSGHHDVSPAYLPDGRIVLTSTRPSGLVPCANNGVDILHVMNADGSGIHPISVNNVNEFDPCVLPDGRLLYGRWEYVDKTALTQQSLWSSFPDGSSETAVFANNMVFPTAILDARPVPGDGHLLVAAFTRHNSPPRGSIAFIDPRVGKNDPGAIRNLEHPDNPTFDQGDSCEPWPLSPDLVLYSGRAPGLKHNGLLLIDRRGQRDVVYADAGIDCHSPMLIKPRPVPADVTDTATDDAETGRFLVRDIYQGLEGVARGEVKSLRVIEETSRTSATPGGAFNQTFLLSAALAFSVKNYLGVVPVEPDGSAYFEVPAGRAVYVQALDAEGRLIRSMRTFVQAVPGVTRSCIGCHEHRSSAAPNAGRPMALRRGPSVPQPESWGSGFVDYPSMVQPVFDRHCVSCHGGEKGIAGKLDLTGGWTEFFSISYENLVSRRESQVTAYLIAGIDCMNGTAQWSARIMPPRAHGSGAAPLAEVLVSGHQGRLPHLTRRERDLVLAWIDTNGLYHGTWDYSKHGASVKAWGRIVGAVRGQMRSAGCLRCHAAGKQVQFEDDWINLERPELSRVLRAPLAPGGEGYGLGWCREAKPNVHWQRICLMLGGRYQHAVRPLSTFRRPPAPPPPAADAKPVHSFASTEDPQYQAMLAAIRRGRRQALQEPRVDMPGAETIPGSFRQLRPTAMPDVLPPLQGRVDEDGIAVLSWERSARTVGLSFELHRGNSPEFTPDAETRLTETPLFEYRDRDAAAGLQHYALVILAGTQRSEPVRCQLRVPAPKPPSPPTKVAAAAAPGRVVVRWQEDARLSIRYHVYRRAGVGKEPERLTQTPLTSGSFADNTAAPGREYVYTVRSVNARGAESPDSVAVAAAPGPEIQEPVFAAELTARTDAATLGGHVSAAQVHGKAKLVDGSLNLLDGGYLSFASQPEFDLGQRLSVTCWVKLERPTQMPVLVSHGVWRQAGWFLQRIGAGWRWHAGGVDCDGGAPAPGRWTHLAAVFDGEALSLYQDGQPVARVVAAVNPAPWGGRLHIGQYSGAPGPPYQVAGRMAHVRIYSRALRPAEIAGAAAAGPGVSSE